MRFSLYAFREVVTDLTDAGLPRRFATAIVTAGYVCIALEAIGREAAHVRRAVRYLIEREHARRPR